MQSLKTTLFDLKSSIQSLLGSVGVEFDAVRGSAIRIGVILLLAFAGWQLIKYLAHRIVLHADDDDDSRLTSNEKRAQTVSQLMRSVGRAVLFLFTLIMILNEFMDIAPILGASAILGLAISFGSQSLVKDFLSGFFILTEGQFAVGDVIEIEGRKGAVERMTLRLVMLRGFDGILHIIPNGQIAVVSNHTSGWSRAVLDIGVAYETDLDRAIAILTQEAASISKDPAWEQRLDGTPEVLGVQELADNAILIRVTVRTYPGNQWEAAREFRLRVKRRFDAEGIEIPFPQRTVHVRHYGPANIESDIVAASGS
ncbi:MAG: mechanosensitive ion channel family protein [Gemmatimonadales bacterium]